MAPHASSSLVLVAAALVALTRAPARAQSCPYAGPDDVDSDNDGTLDPCDGCPLDSEKVDWGLCGCGYADEDTDGDGTPDCFDACDSVPGPVIARSSADLAMSDTWFIGGGSLDTSTRAFPGPLPADTAYHAIGADNPTKLAAGDFDADGLDDLVALHGNDSSLSFLRNDGVGGFELWFTHNLYNSGLPVDLAVAHVDTYPSEDLLVTLGGRVRVYANPIAWGGSYTEVYPFPSFPAPYGPYGITTADFDGDGDIDFAADGHSSSDDRLDLNFNNGAGLYDLGATVGSFGGPLVRDLATGDLDGDARPDLVELTQSGVVKTYLNRWQESASFSPGPGCDGPCTLAVGTSWQTIAVADLDHDGRADVATAAASELITRVSTGDGAFRPAHAWTFPAVVHRDISPTDPCHQSGTCGKIPDATGPILAGDFTGDGKVDLVVAARLVYAASDPSPCVSNMACNASVILVVDLGAGGRPTGIARAIFPFGQPAAGLAAGDFDPVASGEPDTDGDGYADACDTCPGTPKGAPGECGCDLPDADTDLDGVADCADQCPEDPLKNERGCGCGAPDGDLDQDGVVDCRDNCPVVANPLQDNADGDGFGDACDGCPANAAKIAPGLCGCGVADGDTDGDGAPDCEDVDDDGDGICDGADAIAGTCDAGPDVCPTTAGAPQVDSDGDGLGDFCGDYDGDADGVCDPACPTAFPELACSGHGTCDPEAGCRCDPGWAGADCRQRGTSLRYPCAGGPTCNDRGVCDARTGRCVCDEGASGQGCLGPAMPPEHCQNGVDDDGDALVDCADPSCAGDPACAFCFVGMCADRQVGAPCTSTAFGFTLDGVCDGGPDARTGEPCLGDCICRWSLEGDAVPTAQGFEGDLTSGPTPDAPECPCFTAEDVAVALAATDPPFTCERSVGTPAWNCPTPDWVNEFERPYYGRGTIKCTREREDGAHELVVVDAVNLCVNGQTYAEAPGQPARLVVDEHVMTGAQERACIELLRPLRDRDGDGGLECGACVNGTCDPALGLCRCDGGWANDDCDREVPPESDCGNGYDDNGDARIDCDDPTCADQCTCDLVTPCEGKTAGAACVPFGEGVGGGAVGVCYGGPERGDGAPCLGECVCRARVEGYYDGGGEHFTASAPSATLDACPCFDRETVAALLPLDGCSWSDGWFEECRATLPRFGFGGLALETQHGGLEKASDATVECLVEGAGEATEISLDRVQLMCIFGTIDLDDERQDLLAARLSEREAQACATLLDTCTRDLDDNGVRDCLDAVALPPVPDLCEPGPDNCLGHPNADQADLDDDGVGVPCDACPLDPDNDRDADLVCGDVDDCPEDYDPEQLDVAPANGFGDACEPDRDGDGLCTDPFIGEVPACRHDVDCHALLALVGDEQLERDLTPHVACVAGPGPRDGTCRLRASIRVVSQDALGCTSMAEPMRRALAAFNGGYRTAFCASAEGLCVPGLAGEGEVCTGEPPGPECDPLDPDLTARCASQLGAPPGTPFVCVEGTCAVPAAIFADFGLACTGMTVARATGRRHCLVHDTIDVCLAREVAGAACAPPDGGIAGCLVDEDCASDFFAGPFLACGDDGYCEPTPWSLAVEAIDNDGGLGGRCDSPVVAALAGGPRCRVRGADLHAPCGYGDADPDGFCLVPYPCAPGPDNCPRVANADQADRDRDALGDACDDCPDDPRNDQDDDGRCGDADNCPTVGNVDQANLDDDVAGDVCDHDWEGDGACNDPRGPPFLPAIACADCGDGGVCNPRSGLCYCTLSTGGGPTCQDVGAYGEGNEYRCDDGQDDDQDGAADCRDAGCDGNIDCHECAVLIDCNAGAKVVGAPCTGDGPYAGIEGVCVAADDVPAGAPCAGDCACRIGAEVTCDDGCTFEPLPIADDAACPCFDEDDVMALALMEDVSMACETESPQDGCSAAGPLWMNPSAALSLLGGGGVATSQLLRCWVADEVHARELMVRADVNACSTRDEQGSQLVRRGVLMTDAEERACIDLLTRWQVDADDDGLPDEVDPDVVVACPGEGVACNGHGTCNPATGNCYCDEGWVGLDCVPPGGDTVPEASLSGGCSNGYDDDGDGLADCADTSCRDSDACQFCGLQGCAPGAVTGQRCTLVGQSFFDAFGLVGDDARVAFEGRCHGGDVADGTPCTGQCLCVGGGTTRDTLARGPDTGCDGSNEGAACDVGDGGLPGRCVACDELGCSCRRPEVVPPPAHDPDACPCLDKETLGALLGATTATCFGGALGTSPCEDVYARHVPWASGEAGLFGAQTIPPAAPTWACIGGDLTGQTVSANVLALMGSMNMCMNLSIGGDAVAGEEEPVGLAALGFGYHRLTDAEVAACGDLFADCLDQNVTAPGLWQPRDRNDNGVIDCAEDFTDQPRCQGQDNCPDLANADQANADRDARGDACDDCPFDPYDDEDGDALCGDVDNCPTIANDDQTNFDDDSAGDLCDHDWEGDGWCNDARGLPLRPELACLPCAQGGVCNPRTGMCHCAWPETGGALCSAYAYESDEEAGCWNGEDDDEDGAPDCRDPSCAWSSACQGCPVYGECNDGRAVGDACAGALTLSGIEGVCTAGAGVPDGAPCAGECMCRVAAVQQCVDDSCGLFGEAPPMDDVCPCFSEAEIMALALPGGDVSPMACEALVASSEHDGCIAAAPPWVYPVELGVFGVGGREALPTILQCRGAAPGGERFVEVRAHSNVCQAYDPASEALRFVFMTEAQERSCVDILTRWQVDADRDDVPDEVDDDVAPRCPGDEDACGFDGGTCNVHTGRCWCEADRVGDACGYPDGYRERDDGDDACADGEDDDGDGLVDCADASCRDAAPCLVCGMDECGPGAVAGQACRVELTGILGDLLSFEDVSPTLRGQGRCWAGAEAPDGAPCVGQCRCIGGGAAGSVYALDGASSCWPWTEGQGCDAGDGDGGTCRPCESGPCPCVRDEVVPVEGAAPGSDDVCPCFGLAEMGALRGGYGSACAPDTLFPTRCGEALAAHVPSVREDASFFGAATVVEPGASWTCVQFSETGDSERYAMMSLVRDLDACLVIDTRATEAYFDGVYGERGALDVRFERLTPGQAAACEALFTGCLDRNATMSGLWSPSDRDEDGVVDCVQRFSDQPACRPGDNCPDVANAPQDDQDRDDLGDVCDDCPLDPDNDADGDVVCGDVDNCPRVANADQANLDQDARGDVCDSDEDADGFCADLCPFGCSGHGVCGAGGCACDVGWFGAACDVATRVFATCAGEDVDADGDIDACWGQGVCDRLTGRCHCTDPEATGQDCRGEDVSPERADGDGAACGNGVDDDGDGATDCMDAGCAGAEHCYLCGGFLACNDGERLPGDACVEVISGAVFEGTCYAGADRDPSAPCAGDCVCRWQGEFACPGSSCSFDPAPPDDRAPAICPCFDAAALATLLPGPQEELVCAPYTDFGSFQGCFHGAPAWVNPIGALVDRQVHGVQCTLSSSASGDLLAATVETGVNLCQLADLQTSAGTIAWLTEAQEDACVDLIERFVADEDEDGIRDLFDGAITRACPGDPPCGGRGTCDGTTFECLCDLGWSGAACDVWRNPACPIPMSGEACDVFLGYPESCSDGLDDDGDGLADCADAHCLRHDCWRGCELVECNDGAHAVGDACTFEGREQPNGRCYGGAGLPPGAPCTGECVCTGAFVFEELGSEPGTNDCAPGDDGAPCTVIEGVTGECLGCEEAGCWCVHFEEAAEPVAPDACPCATTALFDQILAGALAGGEIECELEHEEVRECGHAYARFAPWVFDARWAIGPDGGAPQAPGVTLGGPPPLPWIAADADIECELEGDLGDLGFHLDTVTNACERFYPAPADIFGERGLVARLTEVQEQACLDLVARCTSRGADGTLMVKDLDGDGRADCHQAPPDVELCVATDCQPRDPAINPGARERCNGLDDDCDGAVDDMPSVELVVEPSARVVRSGDDVTWTVRVVNTSGEDLEGLALEVALPPDAGVTWRGDVVAASGGTLEAAGGTATWPAVTLAPGQAMGVLVVGSVTGPGAGPWAPTARVTGPWICPLDATSSPVTVGAPPVTIVVGTDRDPACDAPPVTTLTLANPGAAATGPVVVTATMPSSGYLPGSIRGRGADETGALGGAPQPATLRWDVGVLQAGEGVALGYTTALDPIGALSGGEAVVTIAGVEVARTAPLTLAGACQPAVTLTKAWDALCAAGDNARVTIAWSAGGAAPVEALRISDRVGDCARATDLGGGACADGLVTWVVGGDAGVVGFDLDLAGVPDGQAFTDRASASGDGLVPVVSNQVGAAVLACDDHDRCTADACSPVEGCTHVLVPDPTIPDDTCDAVDDDCDRELDEDYVGALVSCGLGICVATGVTTCVEGEVVDVCTPLPPAAATDAICDGRDEDCDGPIDEDFAETPTACGHGVCAAGGHLACEGGEVVDTCAPALANATAEACDTLDNDCDGLVDALDPTLVRVACPKTEGVCAGSMRPATACVGGTWLPCGDATYAAHSPRYDLIDRCDGFDNDCDGALDEAFSPSATTCGRGACTRAGQTRCEAGVVVDGCVPGPPSDELCNGEDDDCDDQTDAADPDLVLSLCARQDGVCAGATTTRELCVGGAFEPCPDGLYAAHAPGDYALDDRRCDGVDNDCSGAADEDFVAAVTTCGEGVCDANTGVLTCVAGDEHDSCQPYAGARVETCDGLDDDCDGATDEDFPGKGQACDGDADDDDCEDGVWVCRGDGLALVCDDPPGTGAEVCDGRDNDCDLEVDEGCDDDLDDVCDGVMVCLAGGGLVVPACPLGCGDCDDEDASVSPRAVEVCNGRDDDCRLGVDEGCDDDDDDVCDAQMGCDPDALAPTCPGGCGDCADLQPDVFPGAEERCNLIDDDCDVEVDEGFVTGQACSAGEGGCLVHGLTVCASSGLAVVCDAVPIAPQPERCNHLDDDCDGATDESFALGLPCERGLGACHRDGETVCDLASGLATCDAEVVLGAVEVCNGQDDDCDGFTDNNPAFPTISICPAVDTTITSGPAPVTGDRDAAFTYVDPVTPANDDFTCSLDGAEWTACPGGALALVDLAPGAHVLLVRAHGLAETVDATPAWWVWQVDPTIPDTLIVLAPEDPSQSPTAEFAFEATLPADTWECALDWGGPPSGAPGPDDWFTCDDTWTFTELADGAHRLAVRVTADNGEVDPTPALWSWVVDTTAPDTRITSGPPPVGPDDAATFTYESPSDPTITTFECRLDGGAWARCDGGATTLGDLDEGQHVVEVRAIDGAGVVDPVPARWVFVVDLTPPDTTIPVHPDDPSQSPDAVIGFAADAQPVTFRCVVDPATTPPVAAGYAPCDATIEVGPLADGEHTVWAYAVDAAGHADPTPASYTWTIDTRAPETAITSGPAALAGSGQPAAFTYEDPVTPEHDAFECKLDDGAWAPCDGGAATFTGLAVGTHVFAVRTCAADKPPAFRCDPTPAVWRWEVTVSPCPDDALPPALVCAEALGLECVAGTAALDPMSLAPSASDACGPVSVTARAPERLVLGDNPIVFVVADQNGNQATCLTVVSVLDRVAPAITCPADVVVDNDPGVCGASLDAGAAGAEDACHGAAVFVVDDAPAAFPVGATSVTHRARDEGGLEAACVQTVTVEDAEDMALVCSPSATADAPPDACVWQGTLSARASDNCGVALELVERAGTYPVGETPVVFAALDAAGRKVECTTLLTVRDVTAPVVACGTPVGVAPTVVLATATDACEAEARIDDVRCTLTSDDGIIEPLDPCPVAVEGAALRIEARVGAGALQVDYTASAIDDAGNLAEVECRVTFDPDRDGDGVLDEVDLCPDVADPLQPDGDDDGVGDACDVCPAAADAGQVDEDRDGVGDACDLCPAASDPAQGDLDGDGAGDACDVCPGLADDQADRDADGVGDACQDRDGDGLLDHQDNCPLHANADQADFDEDGLGDACDPFDGDGMQALGSGGCAGAGGPSSLVLLALVALALGLARRRVPRDDLGRWRT